MIITPSCRDCRHSMQFGTELRCTHARVTEIHFETFHRTPWTLCRVQRASGRIWSWVTGTCGIRGRRFEPEKVGRPHAR